MFLQKQITLQQCVHHVVSSLRQWVGYTCQVSTEGGLLSRSSSGLSQFKDSTLKMKAVVPSKRREPITQPQGETTQKTWIFSIKS